MKLSEALFERKKVESRILKMMEYRKAIFHKKFIEIEDEEIEKRERRFSEFLKEGMKEISKLNIEIDTSIEKYINLAHKINEKNFELEADRKLLTMKFIRIEVAALNKLREDKYFSSFDLDRLDKMGIEKRLDEVEETKRKLDNQIQQLNCSNEIML